MAEDRDGLRAVGEEVEGCEVQGLRGGEAFELREGVGGAGEGDACCFGWCQRGGG